jgi:outer membrane receptor protein involved in Fe transport|nr:TonB-dependent receptor [uncultured Flavobacterium sp.]
MKITNRILPLLILMFSKTYKLFPHRPYPKKNLIFLLFVISAYQLPAQSLHGKVLALGTEKYLEGATVVLKGSIHQTKVTNQGGDFNFDHLLPGKYSLYVTCLGFKSRKQDVEWNKKDTILQISLVPSVYKLSNIFIISASRKETWTAELPYTTEVVPSPSQSFQMPRSTPEALSAIPGVFVQKTNHGGGSPYIRGLTGNQTLLLVDGIRLNNSTFRYGPNQYLNTIDPFTIHKMEVLKGSGSVQYGSDALGGVVQVLTKEPDFANRKRFGGNVTLKYWNGDMEKTGRGELMYSAPKMAVLAGISVKDFGDLIGGTTTQRQSPSGYTEIDTDFKIKLKITDQAEVILANQFVQQKNVVVFHKIKLENFMINEMERQKRNLSYLKLKWSPENQYFKVVNVLASLNQTLEGRNSQKNGNNTLRQEKDEVSTANVSIDFYSDFNNKWTANSGIEYYQDRIGSTRKDRNTLTQSIENLRGLYPDGATYKNFSIYNLHHLKLHPFNLEAGVRYNCFKASIEDENLGKVNLSPSALVFNGGLNYTFKKHHFYSSISSGYRAPNIDDMGTLGIVDFRYEIPSYDLKPEKSFNFETGYKYYANKWNVTTAVFYNHLNDLITRVKTDEKINGYSVYKKENIEKAIINGAEISIDYKPSNSLLFSNFFSYTFGQNLTKNEPLRRIPPINGYSSLKYTLTKIYFMGEFVWATSQTRLSQGDKEDNRIPLGGTPGWKVVNLYSGYNLKPLQFRLSAQNLFNKDYRTHGSGINAVGRSIWMSMQYEF